MSKFIDRLDRSSEASFQPMGFSRSQTALQKPKILLVASLNRIAIKQLSDCSTGADAALLTMNKSSLGRNAYDKMYQVSRNIPWGFRLEGMDQKKVKEIETAGCDFVVFSAGDTSLAILESSKMGRILEIEPLICDGLLRSVNDLPLDAVLVTNNGQKQILTWQHLMRFKHFTGLLTKPLLAQIPLSITDKELQMLWEAGVVGVVTVVNVTQSTEGLYGLRRIIEKLDFPLKRGRGLTRPLLPYIKGGTGGLIEEQEE